MDNVSVALSLRSLPFNFPLIYCWCMIFFFVSTLFGSVLVEILLGLFVFVYAIRNHLFLDSKHFTQKTHGTISRKCKHVHNAGIEREDMIFFLLWIELTDFKAEEEREKYIEKSSYLIEQANNVQNSNNTIMLVGMGHHRSCCLMLVHFFFVIFLYSFAHHFSGKNYFIVMVWSIAIDEQNV